MEKTINTEQAAQVTSYILELKEQNARRDHIIEEKKKRMEVLQNYVDEYNGLKEECEELKSEIKDQTKFVKQLVDFAEKASGKSMDNLGTLFENISEERS